MGSSPRSCCTTTTADLGIGSDAIGYRLAPDLAPELGEGAQRPLYRIRIEGEPDISCDMTASLVDPKASGSVMESGAGAMVATAMRVVNAIPYVVEAKPGLLSALDLPLTLPRNVLR